MRTNIEINDELMEKALAVSKLKTKKEVVDTALKEYINQLYREELRSLGGKIEWDGDLDAMRSTL